MKESTISQIVDAIIRLAPPDADGDYKDINLIANEACIYLKMGLICEKDGIEKAMEYYLGTHDLDEYRDFIR